VGIAAQLREAAHLREGSMEIAEEMAERHFIIENCERAQGCSQDLDLTF
jgi:hypothetical protein